LIGVHQLLSVFIGGSKLFDLFSALSAASAVGFLVPEFPNETTKER
jgi:hypothetical protein